MSTTDAPFGLKRARRLGGTPVNEGFNTYKLLSLTTATIYTGQPVRLTADGAVDELTSAGITTGPAVGVFLGCKFTDPVSKRPTWSRYWPGGTSATDAVAFVVDDPNATFEIQANSSVGATAVGAVAGLTTASYTSGSTAYGGSYGKLAVASITTSNGLLRILGIKDVPGNTASDAYTVVEVQIANHQFNTTAGV